MGVQKKAYTAGHFELMIDGHKTTCYVKSVDGGQPRANAVNEPIGAKTGHIKSLSTMDVEPFTIDLGISGAKDILKWVQASWKQKYTRRNGQITHANFNLNSTLEHEFFEALLTEVTFPTLDGAAKDTAYLKVKIQPEWVKQRTYEEGPKLVPEGGTKQKMWTGNSFRFVIDGIDDMQYTNKLESFTVKQGIKKFYTGEDRLPHIEPTKLEWPNIVGTISMDKAKALFDWHKQYIVDGQTEKGAQKTAYLEYLAPNKKDVLFAISMDQVGLHSLQVVQSQANQDAIKRVKFELFVGEMTLDGAMFGMD